MGKLIYGPGGGDFEIEDRTLAHLQIVMIAKLRRSESFAFTWSAARDFGEGRTVLWMHPAQYLQFRYHGSRQPAINRQWVEDLMAAANSVAGLRLVPESDGPGTADAEPLP
jgi:hypothetical protein